MNAVEGSVAVPPLFAVKEIDEADSLVPFWIERPEARNGTVRFSGIIPGGLSSNAVFLFSILVEAEAEGTGAFSFANVAAFLNDGKGTAAKRRTVPLRLSVAPSGKETAVAGKEDLEPPERFIPLIGQAPSLFEGKHFLAFFTKDRQSGIARYEVAEKMGFRRFRYGQLPWREATSPSVLADQTLRSVVYVKAIDKKGNVRIAVVSPTYPPFFYKYEVIFAILIILGALFFYAVRARYAARAIRQD